MLEMQWEVTPSETTRTYDGRVVYPAFAALPLGASGWTQCTLFEGSYATWVEPSELDHMRADLRCFEAEAHALRTKVAGKQALAYLGLAECEIHRTLEMMRVQFVNRRMALAWPLRCVD